jgi:hypothetical protein
MWKNKYKMLSDFITNGTNLAMGDKDKFTRYNVEQSDNNAAIY